MSRILLTGFEPFGGASSNPSQAIVEAFESEYKDRGLISTLVLPVEFGRAAELLIKAIDETKPEFVISLGQAEGRTAITPERVAVNIDDARIADNAGNQVSEREIVKGGPAAYFTTLPIKEMVDAMVKVGVPSSISNSAGTFVCNHIFYAAQDYCVGKKIKSGFIHLPLMSAQSQEFPGVFTMELSEMIKGIRAAISVVI